MAQTQTQLPDATAAYNHLFNNIHSNVFFNKLAQAGYPVTTKEAAADALGLAAELRQIAEVETQKQASANPFGLALTGLTGVLQREGRPTHTKTAAARDQALAIKQAAAHIMQDPTIYNSVLALKAAEAAQFAA